MKKDLKLKLKKFFHSYDWKIKVKIITFVLIILLITCDQLVKLWVRKNLAQDFERPFLLGFINLKYVINYGSAFGFNQGKTVFLVVFTFLVAFALLIWWIFSRTTVFTVGASFIFAGAIGNLIDRFLFNGGVIDFLKWDMFKPMSIFNVADILITVGVIIIVSYLIIDPIKTMILEKKAKKGNKKINEKNSTTN